RRMDHESSAVEGDRPASVRTAQEARSGASRPGRRAAGPGFRAGRCHGRTAIAWQVAAGLDGAHRGRAASHRDRIFWRADLLAGGDPARPAARDGQDAHPVRARETSQGARKRGGLLMTAKPKTGCEQTERVFEYALRALPSSERAAFEAH